MALAFAVPARANDLKEFSSRGLAGSQGFVVRIQHPASWKPVDLDDVMAIAELRGPQDGITGILQVARGVKRADASTLCSPERAQTMLRNLEASDARVTDVLARTHEDRPAFEVRYERSDAPSFLLARSLIVCLKQTRVLVSCGATNGTKAALTAIEPVCRQVLDSVSIAED